MSEELHPPETITTIYLVRHGHTEAIEKGKLYNDPEVEITDKGVAQAKALGVFLNEICPDALLSSTAKRVVSTAKLIEAELKMTNETQEDLNEWSVGDWEGRTYLEVKKEDPEDYKNWSCDPIKNAPPGGESIEDLFERVRKRISEIVLANEGKSIALVTHAGVVRSILLNYLDIPVRNFWRISVSAGSVSKVDISENFATVHYINKTP